MNKILSLTLLLFSVGLFSQELQIRSNGVEVIPSTVAGASDTCVYDIPSALPDGNDVSTFVSDFTSGVKIGTHTADGVSTDVYVPTVESSQYLLNNSDGLNAATAITNAGLENSGIEISLQTVDGTSVDFGGATYTTVIDGLVSTGVTASTLIPVGTDYVVSQDGAGQYILSFTNKNPEELAIRLINGNNQTIANDNPDRDQYLRANYAGAGNTTIDNSTYQSGDRIILFANTTGTKTFTLNSFSFAGEGVSIDLEHRESVTVAKQAGGQWHIVADTRAGISSNITEGTLNAATGDRAPDFGGNNLILDNTDLTIVNAATSINLQTDGGEFAVSNSSNGNTPLFVDMSSPLGNVAIGGHTSPDELLTVGNIGNRGVIGVKRASDGNTTGYLEITPTNNLQISTTSGSSQIILKAQIGLGDPNLAGVVVPSGDVETTTNGRGFIMVSPDGLTRVRISIDNTGALVTTTL